MTKNQVENEILRAFEHAKENGFRVVVASDEEGNSWNDLDLQNLFYASSKNNILIGVIGYADESEIFGEKE